MSRIIATIIDADLDNPAHQQAIVALLDAYSRDVMGNGRPLADEVRSKLIDGLRTHPTTLVLLAYHEEQPVGIATCFRGFSTFAAQPLLNIHDVAVVPEFRGRAIGRQLLQAAEQRARDMGCCKMTLEVLEDNPARRLYESLGFGPPEYGRAAVGTWFLSKPL